MLCLAVLAAITLALPIPQWRTGRQAVRPLSLEPGEHFVQRPTRIWIDTDAACGASPRTDPDDCFAILALADDPELEVAGISTSFGNAPLEVTDRTTRELVTMMADRPTPLAVHTGSAGPIERNHPAAEPAHEALRSALARGSLTIVALGPLTNVAAALHLRSDLQARVTRVIAVMGSRPGHLFHPTEGARGAMLFGHGPIFQDLNFASDRLAVVEIMRTHVPLVLVPYDAAAKVELTRADLERMRARGGAPAWVADRASGWLDFWRDDIGREGFYPFDLVAATLAMRPDLLRCALVPVRAGEDPRFRWPFREQTALLAGPDAIEGADADATLAVATAIYCPSVADDLQSWLASILGGGPMEALHRGS